MEVTYFKEIFKLQYLKVTIIAKLPWQLQFCFLFRVKCRYSRVLGNAQHRFLWIKGRNNRLYLVLNAMLVVFDADWQELVVYGVGRKELVLREEFVMKVVAKNMFAKEEKVQ